MAPTFADGNSLFDFVVRQGNGVKGLVDSGLPTVPNEYIQPLEERISKQDVRKHLEQPIDLSELDGPNHGKIVKALTRAAETIGFFQVVNHGVPVEVLERLKVAAHRFFNQPPEKKAVYLKGVSPTPFVTYGTSYVPEKEKVLMWKDTLSMVYTCDDDAMKYWPEEVREDELCFLKTSPDMVRKIMGVLFESLGVKLDDPMADAYFGARMCNMNFYPQCPNPDLAVGAVRHSDIGTLTVLLQDGIGGLHVKMEDERDAENKGEWVEIPPVPGALVINIGDILQILSNGRYKSAEHRVRTTSMQSRVSCPLFYSPQLATKITPLPHVVEKDGRAHYNEVSFQDYISNFVGKAHVGKKSLDFVKITVSP
ncbi:scopoletin 8-hydroxylase-like [Macadamia integrifolia]|uniref:scopoletin 8-hydroxylase-like n=1 Tax=Macadamia integrifolia TaxID=60698 RepID=UPI001C4E5C11|nr:scopoletin 8-hydroxylase-like [Macadamia integrifolia]